MLKLYHSGSKESAKITPRVPYIATFFCIPKLCSIAINFVYAETLNLKDKGHNSPQELQFSRVSQGKSVSQK